MKNMFNIDPNTIKQIAQRLGIKTNEIRADKVTIEGKDFVIIIDNPTVVEIDAKGVKQYQISGDIKIENKEIEIAQDDIDFIKNETGINDEEKIRNTLKECNGDIALAIKKLKANTQS